MTFYWSGTVRSPHWYPNYFQILFGRRTYRQTVLFIHRLQFLSAGLKDNLEQCRKRLPTCSKFSCDLGPSPTTTSYHAVSDVLRLVGPLTSWIGGYGREYISSPDGHTY